MRALLLALLAAPAAAQGRPEVEALLDRALAEQSTLLTCLALDPDGHQVFADAWEEAAAATVAALEAAGYDPEAVSRFRERAAVPALMPPPEATFAEVRARCATEMGEGFRNRMFNFRLVVLPDQLEPLLR